MKIVIVGVGKLGEYLAKSLVREGHAVTLVDVDFTTAQDIINNEDLNYIDGNGLDVSILKEAGANIIVAGSSIINSKDYKAVIGKIKIDE